MNFQDAIKYIKDSVNIQEVISEFVNLKKRGINYTGLCPFHNDRHSSFSVSPTKQIYKCFACGKTGDVYQFLIDYENMTSSNIKYIDNQLVTVIKIQMICKCKYKTI